MGRINLPCKRSDVVCKELDDEVILFDPLTNVTHRLNPTATWIYLSCDGMTSPEELSSRYQHAFGVETAVSDRDVNHVLSSFERLALLADEA